MNLNALFFIFLTFFNLFGAPAVSANICPPQTKQEAAYEPLKAFTDNGITTVIVPKESSIYYLGLKHIIDNSTAFKNMQKNFSPGTKLTFAQLTTAQIDDLLKLVAGTEMALSDEAYLRQKIERKNFFDVLLTLQTAEHLDMPLLAQIALEKLAKNLQDSSLLTELNENPAYLTMLLSLSPSTQKEIAKKIIASFPYIQTHKLDNVTLYNYEVEL